MIGAALLAAARGAGHRPIAARLGVPAASVRGWLRRFRTLAGRLGTRLLAFAAAADPGIPHTPAGTPLAVAVGAVGAAALARLSGEPVAPMASGGAHRRRAAAGLTNRHRPCRPRLLDWPNPRKHKAIRGSRRRPAGWDTTTRPGTSQPSTTRGRRDVHWSRQSPVHAPRSLPTRS